VMNRAVLHHSVTKTELLEQFDRGMFKHAGLDRLFERFA